MLCRKRRFRPLGDSLVWETVEVWLLRMLFKQKKSGCSRSGNIRFFIVNASVTPAGGYCAFATSHPSSSIFSRSFR